MENFRRLPPRLKRFVEALAEGLTLKDAALRIKPDSRNPRGLGWKLSRKPQVVAAWEELNEEVTREAGITILQVLLDANAIKRRCMQAEPVRDRKGEPTGEYQFDSTGANKANEFLGKYLKIAPERHELTGKDGAPLIPRTVDDLTDEQLAAIAAGGRAAPVKSA